MRTGDVKFLKEVKSPWPVRIYLEKFERGQWNLFLLDRKYPDFCAALQVPTEPLYPFFNQFEKKECPFPEGHVQTFVNGQITSLPEQVPDQNFGGKYRLVVEYTYMEGLESHVDCLIAAADVFDI